MTLDLCVSAAVTTSNSGASLEKSSTLTVELSNDVTPTLAVFDAVLMPSNRDENSFSRVLSLSIDADDNQSVSNCRPDSAVAD